MVTSYPVIELTRHYRIVGSGVQHTLTEKVSAIAQSTTYAMLVYNKQRNRNEYLLYWKEPISEKKLAVVCVLLSEYQANITSVQLPDQNGLFTTPFNKPYKLLDITRKARYNSIEETNYDQLSSN